MGFAEAKAGTEGGSAGITSEVSLWEEKDVGTPSGGSQSSVLERNKGIC
jgi:hypothetical protein